MSDFNPISLLYCLPENKRDDAKAWMTECGVTEAALTVPLMSLLAGCCELEDEGMRNVMAAMIKQEARSV